MSSRNDETTGMFLAIAFIGAAAMILAAVVFAILAFIALVMTILCICAWDKPIGLGKFSLEPREARAFVWRGAAGVLILPTFLAFASLLLGVPINWDYLPHILIAGYTGGSVGMEILMAQQAEENGAPVQPLPPAQIAAPPRKALPRSEPEAEPFRFARWDDEEDER